MARWFIGGNGGADICCAARAADPGNCRETCGGAAGGHCGRAAGAGLGGAGAGQSACGGPAWWLRMAALGGSPGGGFGGAPGGGFGGAPGALLGGWFGRGGGIAVLGVGRG